MSSYRSASLRLRGVVSMRLIVLMCFGPLCLTSIATAQTRPVPRRPVQNQQSSIGIRGFADIGTTFFSASRSFESVLGSARGSVFGGGVEVVLPRNVFVNLRASRFSQTGERVFLLNGEQFNLGIDTSITITPLELTGGYRFARPSWWLVPYAGAGVGWYRYEETSDFATDAENVQDRFTGFQLLGGAEFRVRRWIGAAAEVEWATVPDAIGQDTNSVSREFGDTNLGGVTLRVKVVIGR